MENDPKRLKSCIYFFCVFATSGLVSKIRETSLIILISNVAYKMKPRQTFHFLFHFSERTYWIQTYLINFVARFYCVKLLSIFQLAASSISGGGYVHVTFKNESFFRYNEVFVRNLCIILCCFSRYLKHKYFLRHILLEMFW